VDKAEVVRSAYQLHESHMQVGVEEYLGNVYAAAAAVDHDYLGDYVQELVEDVGWYEQL